MYKLENIPEYVEDPMIREIRTEKGRQLKKEEEDKIARTHFEKVFNAKFIFYLDFIKF